MLRFLLAALVALSGAPPAPSGSALVDCLARAPAARWLLPFALREISGLALTGDGRLLAHGDEYAVVSEINYRTGRIVKTFRFGRGIVPGDFEGIAVAGPRVYLVTSSGLLYEGREGKDGEAVPYTVTATGAGSRCEVEGLDWEPRGRALLLLCKTPRVRALSGAITLLRWSPDQNRWLAPDRVTIPLGEPFRKTYGGEFRGSGLARDPVTGRYLAVAGINHAVAELEPDGRIIGAGFLGRHHRQAEGIAIAPDGTVLVSDEGGRGAGRLAVYACGRGARSVR